LQTHNTANIHTGDMTTQATVTGPDLDGERPGARGPRASPKSGPAQLINTSISCLHIYQIALTLRTAYYPL